MGFSACGLADSQLSDVPVPGGKTQVGKLQERCGEFRGGIELQ